jgi:hypothetical protein
MEHMGYIFMIYDYYVYFCCCLHTVWCPKGDLPYASLQKKPLDAAGRLHHRRVLLFARRLRGLPYAASEQAVAVELLLDSDSAFVLRG